MIDTYLPPRSYVYQKLQTGSTSSTPVLAACMVGPRYLLNRQGKQDCPETAFDAAGAVLSWEYKDADGATQSLPATYAVDTDTVKLYAAEMEAALATFTNGFKVPDLAEPNVIKINSDLVSAGDSGDLAAALRGRNVQVGDIVYVNDGNATVRRTVKSLRAAVAASSHGNATNSAYNPAATSAAVTAISVPTGHSIAGSSAASFDGAAVGSKLGTEYGEEFIVTVTTSGAATTSKVTVATTSGHFAATNVASEADTSTLKFTNLAGSGVLLKIDQASLTAGDVYRFEVRGDYARLVNATDITIAGTYIGTKNTAYLIEVTGTNDVANDYSGATVTITDTAGVDETITDYEITDDTAFDLGSLGLTAKFTYTDKDPGMLRVGDVFYVVATAEAETPPDYDTIVLDGPAVDTELFTDEATNLPSVVFRLEYSGEIESDASEGGTAWAASADGLEYEAGLALYIAERATGYQWCAFADAVGTLSPSYRAVVPTTTAEKMGTISAVEDIEDLLGEIDQENPLAFAANEAIGAAGGNPVYYLSTGGIDTTAFAAALKKIASTNLPWGLAVLTEDADVIALCKAHAIAQSAPDVKHGRAVYVGVASPGQYRVLGLQEDDTYYLCTITAYGGGNKKLTVVDGETDLTLIGLEEDDIITLPVAGGSYAIDSVLSATEILLKTGPDAPIGTPGAAFFAYRADSVSSQKAYVRALARQFAHERVTLCWYEGGTRTINGAITEVHPMFAAAYLAGARSAIAPQLGMSRLEVTTITDATPMFNRYDDTDLNEVAADGVLIITQDVESGKVYVRHQLTTNSNDGILYFEDNIKCVMDTVMRRHAEIIDAYIGRKNASTRSLQNIRRDLERDCFEATQADIADEDGPLIAEYSDLVVERDATQPNVFNTSVQLGIDTPLGRVNHTLYGRYSQITPATAG